MVKSPIHRLRQEFQRLANPSKAKILAGFFKTGKGEYAQGDQFYGVVVGQTRAIAKKYAQDMTLPNIRRLLQTGKHEERLCVLFILVEKFKKAKDGERKKIYDFYLANAKYINNWDLVDTTAYHVVGAHLANKPKTVLEKLARSKNIWERRIAIVSTFYFIQRKECQTTFKIANILLKDKHDLIHKATGWMLRETGKKCGEAALENYLRPRYPKMPRTMLRYAIERFPQKRRQEFLNRN